MSKAQMPAWKDQTRRTIKRFGEPVWHLANAGQTRTLSGREIPRLRASTSMARVTGRKRTAPVVLLALAGALLGGTARPVASFVVPASFLQSSDRFLRAGVF